MAFDTLQVEAVAGLLSFTNTIGHQSTGGALSTWRGREREIGESEMNNLTERNRDQQPHVTTGRPLYVFLFTNRIYEGYE